MSSQPIYIWLNRFLEGEGAAALHHPHPSYNHGPVRAYGQINDNVKEKGNEEKMSQQIKQLHA